MSKRYEGLETSEISNGLYEKIDDMQVSLINEDAGGFFQVLDEIQSDVREIRRRGQEDSKNITWESLYAKHT